jgi:hypothetical protein
MMPAVVESSRHDESPTQPPSGEGSFSRVVLVRRYGGLRTTGRTRLDEHKGEGKALAALMALEASKQRRGYRPIA